MSKSTRIRLAVVITAVAGVLAWRHLRDEPRPAPQPATTRNTAMEDAIARGRAQITAARAATRAQQPERKVVAPPATLELPPWATHLPTQPEPGVPTPRGAE
jgi:hypothetical protein